MVLQMKKGRRQPQVTSLLQNFPSILILGTVPALETRHRVSAHEAATRGEPGCCEEHTKPREVRCTFHCDHRPTASPEEPVIKKTLQPHWSPSKVTANGGSLDTRRPAQTLTLAQVHTLGAYSVQRTHGNRERPVLGVAGQASPAEPRQTWLQGPSDSRGTRCPAQRHGRPLQTEARRHVPAQVPQTLESEPRAQETGGCAPVPHG